MSRPLSRFCSLLLLCIAATYSVHAEDSDTVWTVKIPGTSFVDVQYSPDGNYIAAASGWVYLLDAKDGSVIRQFKSPGAITSLFVPKIAFSADGRIIAAAVDQNSNEHKIQFWNVETGEPTWSISTPNLIGVMAFSPDGRFFAVGDGVENFCFYQVENDTISLLWQDTEPGPIHRGIWFSQDGEYIVYAKGGVMKLRRTVDSLVLQKWYNVGGECQATPDLKYFLATVPGGVGIYIQDYAKPIDTLHTGVGEPVQVEITKGGKYVLTWSNARVEVWDFDSRKVVNTYSSGQFAISPDSAYIASSMGAGYIYLYRFNTGTTSVGSEQEPQGNALRVIPNPSDGQATALFHIPGTTPVAVELDIVDAQGAVLHHVLNEILPTGEHSIPLPMIETSGTYFCRLRTATSQQIVRMVTIR